MSQPVSLAERLWAYRDEVEPAPAPAEPCAPTITEEEQQAVAEEQTARGRRIVDDIMAEWAARQP